MVNSLVEEIRLRKDYLSNEPIETIYFGGGTPSMLSQAEICGILETIYKHFTVNVREITLEANPDDLSADKLRALKTAGINRLSIGIQSFDDGILKTLNRVHDSKVARQSIDMAYEAGFDNISIDLIYAIPGQDDVLWKQNIESALAYRPKHISAYALTVEEKTVFGRRAKAGNFTLVEDDFAALQLQMLVEILTQSGYDHYEVSNFSLPGFNSMHNSSYWKDVSYLGIGPSAHSYDGSSRQFNISNNRLYTDSLIVQKIPATIEILSREDKINEYLLTLLRTSWGVSLERLRVHYGHDIIREQGDYIRELQQREIAVVKGDQLVLTEKGRLLADKIASDLFVLPSQ